MRKVIITAAITGATTMPSQSDYLPITPEQIAGEAVRACAAGASVVHIHGRDPADGSPSSDLNIFRQIVTSVKSQCDVVICTSTGGGAGMTLEERVSVVPELQPELASFNCGSMNFGIFPVASRIKSFKYQWEKPFLEKTRDFVFKNTFYDMEYACSIMYNYGTKPELEIYDLGQLYNVRYLLSQGVLRKPIHLQFVMGVLGGIGNGPEDLMHMKETSDRLFGSDYTWSVIGVGYPAEFHLGAMAVILGGHVRVGLEDNLRLDYNNMARSNAELVEKAVRIVRELGFDIATPGEARQMLNLKGQGGVNF